ncbi:hypothetical protein [Streptomyces winkii]|uniref:hypothetical protein n=1 Tax=Streptomyces winkii TaxID=3051178 RepID=UPI0028D31B30|nr:hypothetical protein [Streptomyces sp. DSM 40971]
MPWLDDIEPLSGCSAGMLPVGDGPLEPCVVEGRHDEHRTAEGRRWSFDLDAAEPVPVSPDGSV